MVSETVEAPAEPQTDPEPQPQETETQVPLIQEEEGAAPEAEAAAVPQVEVTEPEKPAYVTVEQWEREKAEIAARAAAEALEADRRRRQTENARKAQQEERQKARIQHTVDTVKAAMVARGLDPEVVTEQSVITAIDRVAQERAEWLAGDQAERLVEAWDYLTAPVYGKSLDFDATFEAQARALAPKIQHLINTMRPQIEAKAREGYIPESELPERVKAEIERRNAESRRGQDDLKRVEGSPASAKDMTLEAVTNRIIANAADEQDRKFWDDRFGKRR